MTERTSRRLLTASLWLAAPLPVYAGPVWAVIPVARTTMLGAVCGLVMILETPRGAAGPLTAMFLVQAGVGALLGWALAALTARAVCRATLVPRYRGLATLALLLVGLGITATWPLYYTPFRADAVHSALGDVFR